MNHILRKAIKEDNWVIALVFKMDNGESLTEKEKEQFFHGFVGKHFGEDAVFDMRQSGDIAEDLCREVAAIGKEIGSRNVNITF